ncbi:MAG: hypothetical protein ABEJ98_05915 [Candidatus Nanohaloarchaea archaeon]
MRSEKGFTLPINLLLVMVVLVILAAVITVVSNDYITQFKVFGVNHSSTGLNPFS